MFRAARTSSHVAKRAPEEHQSFYDCFVTFRDVMDVCFGFTLGALYRKNVSLIPQECDKLCSLLCKATLVNHHKGVCFNKTCTRIGHFCEQVLERSHSKFYRLFIHYKIKDSNHLNYLKNWFFFCVILHFNSSNI